MQEIGCVTSIVHRSGPKSLLPLHVVCSFAFIFLGSYNYFSTPINPPEKISLGPQLITDTTHRSLLSPAAEFPCFMELFLSPPPTVFSPDPFLESKCGAKVKLPEVALHPICLELPALPRLFSIDSFLLSGFFFWMLLSNFTFFPHFFPSFVRRYILFRSFLKRSFVTLRFGAFEKPFGAGPPLESPCFFFSGTSRLFAGWMERIYELLSPYGV